MRKLTILGLSLLLSVGAFAQTQLPPVRAQKLNEASAAKTEKTVTRQWEYKGRYTARTAPASQVPGMVEQRTYKSRALAKSNARSIAKSAVTTDKIYAGMGFPTGAGGKLDVATGAFTQIFSKGPVHVLGFNGDLNEFYTSEYETLDLWGSTFLMFMGYRTYDAATGSLKEETELEDAQGNNYIKCGAYHLEDNAIYGFANNGWAKFDCTTHESTILVPIADSEWPRDIIALTYNSNIGKFVGIFKSNGAMTMATVDKETAAFGTRVPVTGADTQYIGGLAYDYSSNNYLFNPNDDDTSTIVAIDADTYAVTTLCSLDDVEYGGYTYAPETYSLYVDEVKPADPLAPLAPEFVSASFPDGAFTGTVTYTLPTLTVGGTDLSGQVSYTITANGTEIAAGASAPGSEVSASYTASASGDVSFSCVASQDTHVSKSASQSVYIGNDTPAAPLNVTLAPDVVTWAPVTTGVHGGYVDVEKMTYTVTINGNTVAEGVRGTSCPTNLPVTEPIASYVASVTASCNGLTGEAGRSNDMTFGQPFNLPVSFAPTAKEAAMFSIINNNNDPRTWEYNATNQSFRIRYNSSEAMDDYLLLPPVMIQNADGLYHFKFDTWSISSYYPEKVEVWIGQEATAEAMTTKILDTTTVTWNELSEDKTLECYFPVPKTGRWYVAVKGVSDADMNTLYVNNFSLSQVEGVAAKGPAGVENAVAVPGQNGALTATVNFTLPTKANDGSALAGQVSATVESGVDSKVVSGAPGSTQTVELTTVQGDNNITIQTKQGDLNGFPVVLNVYTGVVVADVVSNFKMTTDQTNYGIDLSFDAPESGVDGGYINTDDLTYALYFNPTGYNSDWQKLLDLGKNTHVSVTLLEEGTPQDSYILGVGVHNVAGDSQILGTNIVIGQPFDMPAIEDYAKGSITYQPIMLNSRNGMSQSYLSAEGLDKLNPEFGAKGPAIVGQGGGQDGQYGEFFLPAFSTKGADKAALELSYYVGACKNVIVYAETYGIDTKEIFNQSYLFGYPDGFRTLPIELPAEFQNKDWVKLTIRCDFSTDKKYFVWNGYRLINMVQKDITVLDVKAPAKATAGTDYDVTVNVANYGLSTATDYSVELYADGEKVAEKAGAELASFADGQVVFTQSMSPIATEPVEYYAKAVQAGDANTANNQTATVAVSPRPSNLPGATELTAADSENAVALTWNEPDLTAVTPDPVTDDFEDANAFAAEYGDWVFVDVDEEKVGGFQGTDIPGITPGETQGSFWIWDQSQLGNQSFAAHSGTKYLFSLFSYQDNQVDDWAISPQLYGGEQTVSFWARSYSADYPEKIEVYYSTGSTDPKDFVLIEGSKVDAVPAEWTEYSVDLPQGATRFAIRSYAAGSFMLMVDDVTYTPAAAFTGEISLKGYDVYRDGVKLNDAPVENNAYADSNVVKGTEYKYVVVALFDEGTGRVSNTASIVYGQSGLDELGATKAIATAKNTIIVRGFAGEKVIVSSADGKVIANGEASEISSISVPAGVYVVKAGNKSVKVVVK